MPAFSPDSGLVTRVVASPNHDARAARVDMIVLHYTGMARAEDALARRFGEVFEREVMPAAATA